MRSPRLSDISFKYSTSIRTPAAWMRARTADRGSSTSASRSRRPARSIRSCITGASSPTVAASVPTFGVGAENSCPSASLSSGSVIRSTPR